MTDKQIEIALGFYGIDDVRYRSALRACLEEITKNEILSNGFKTAGKGCSPMFAVSKKNCGGYRPHKIFSDVKCPIFPRICLS